MVGPGALFALCQTRRAQNVYYALIYEKVYDRYGQTNATNISVTAIDVAHQAAQTLRNQASAAMSALNKSN